MTRETVAQAVKKSRSYKATLEALGLPVCGYHHKKLKEFIERHRISTRHFGRRQTGIWG